VSPYDVPNVRVLTPLPSRHRDTGDVLNPTRPIRLALLVAAALCLAGCGSSSADDGPTSSTPASVSSAAEPSSSAPAEQSSAPASSSAPAGPAGCTTADLSVTLGPGEGAAGSTYYPVTMTNKGSQACRTGGFGGVSLVDSPRAEPIGAPADRTQQGDVVAITLQPGQAATATLQVSEAGNYSKTKCQPVDATALRVYPPNETHAAYVKLPATVSACANAKVHLLTLRPYQPAG
jgi:hypothetical protein